MIGLLETRESGLYCPAGDFYIDPWSGVDRAIITHAHTDHARRGSRSYLTARPGAALLQTRLPGSQIEAIDYGEPVHINGVRVSLHPAGHLLGSSQVRVEYRGEVWVVSGDYKTEADRTCATFEPVSCHVFITESTFALPIYRWRPQEEIFSEINAWWRENQEVGRTSVLMGYSLGKAQRLLAGVDPELGPIFIHRSVAEFLPAYEAAGIRLPATAPLEPEAVRASGGRALVIAPPGGANGDWLSQIGPYSTAFASGWMLTRKTRRQRGADRGFVLSDHVDWPAVLGAIEATGAERIGVTHGYTSVLVRFLREHGYQAWMVGAESWVDDDS